MVDMLLGGVDAKLSSFPSIWRAFSTSEHPTAMWGAVQRWKRRRHVWNKTEVSGRICPSEGPTVKQQCRECSMSLV